VGGAAATVFGVSKEGKMAKDTLQIVASSGTREGHMILTLRGCLNIHTISDFQSATRAETAPKLILDFSGVSYVDSAGLGALVGVYVAAQRTQRKLVVAGPSKQVKALIEMTQVGTLISSYATVHEAEEALL
jgi:anti-sigma B factor antagonist